MLTTGIDLIDIDRIEAAISRQGARFLDRIFTEQEQDYCKRNAGSLAARFAIKEAVSKALNAGIGDMRWLDIEVICDDRGKPHLKLHAAAADIATAQGWTNWSISISHTKTQAIGIAIANRG